ncbi:MAG: 6-carboxytetrahydropterin synthase [Xanthomonadales bacterium]|nr:6-carboxytetrahydropterin synthase [Xanthomonadales bacterium]MCB1643099.1 6-carboxytetrahydropterin synthase [Xanthomonadales bacterium]
MVEVYKQFTFEAAHTLPQFPGVHGHSYSVEVRCSGPALDGYVIPEDAFEAALVPVRQALDHRMLNDFIEVPTSENIARWIWAELAGVLPLTEVRVWRPSVGFGAIYRGG